MTPMQRRNFITLLGGAAAAWPLAARAQQPDERLPALQSRILRLQAETAADKINRFLGEIQSQLGWTTQLPWSAGTIDQRRFDGLRLLRQVPAITALEQLDSAGIEQLKVSRLAMDVVASKGDFSKDPKFTEAMAKQVYYGPVYVLRQDRPYMTLSLAGTRRDAGVSVAMVSLKLVWDIVTGLKVGEHGVAYLLDTEGRVIAHSGIETYGRDAQGRVTVELDLSLFQKDFSSLAHVQAARAANASGVQVVQDSHGREVLTAYAPVAPLGWLVFVELPAEEANALAQ
jgi:cache domain-containing protein